MFVGAFKVGYMEIILAFAVILLVFGPSKLPQIGSAIGKGIREFRSASKDIKKQLDIDLDERDSSEELKS